MDDMNLQPLFGETSPEKVIPTVMANLDKVAGRCFESESQIMMDYTAALENACKIEDADQRDYVTRRASELKYRRELLLSVHSALKAVRKQLAACELVKPEKAK